MLTHLGGIMYKNATVCVNNTDRHDNAIRAAARFANDVSANLTGLYVNESYAKAGAAYGLSPYAMISDDLFHFLEQRNAEQATKAKENFQKVTDESQISNYLSEHNVVNNFHLKILIKFAAKKSADLIVVGGYDHTRLREIILGSVHEILVNTAQYPFYSHIRGGNCYA